jgi:hypothetical protein
MLTSHDIARVDRIFVLGADFDAIDDIVRLAITYQSKEIFIPPTLVTSFSEIRRRLELEPENVPLTSFPSQFSVFLADGIYPSSRGILVQLNGHRILFCQEIESEHFELTGRIDTLSFLICGYLPRGDLSHLDPRRWSKIAQQSGLVLLSVPADQALPVELVDLSAVGGVHLRFLPGPLNSPELTIWR